MWEQVVRTVTRVGGQAVDYAGDMGCKCPRDSKTCCRGNIITTLVYDNACNLYHYFLARETEIARRFKFFVDRFHFKGHKNCSPYMSQGRDAATRQINSSANEQMNRQVGDKCDERQPGNLNVSC